MTTKKKTLKSLKENQEHLPVHPSDASADVQADSLAGKGKKEVKPEQNGKKVADEGGQHGDAQAVQIPEEEEKDKEAVDEAAADLPTHPSDAAVQIPDKLKEEDELPSEDDDEEPDEEPDEENISEDDIPGQDDSQFNKKETDLSEKVEKELQKEDEKEIKEHVDALTSDDSLPAEFKEKAATIFEAAVKSASKRRVDAYKAKLAEAYSNKLAEKTEEISESLVDKVDGYLDYVVEEWMKENEVAIESGLKSEIVEKFILGLKGLFESHYIEVPADKTDVLAEQETKISGLEKDLNEALNKNVELRQKLILSKKEAVIKKLSESLADTDAAKFSELCEGVSFENEEAFSEKLKVIKETYFPKTPKRKSDLDSDLLAEGGIEPQEKDVESKSKDTMDLAVDAISRLVKR